MVIYTASEILEDVNTWGSEKRFDTNGSLDGRPVQFKTGIRQSMSAAEDANRMLRMRSINAEETLKILTLLDLNINSFESQQSFPLQSL